MPAALYGPHAAADRRARAWVRKLGGGPAGPLDRESVDTAERPGLLLLNPPAGALRGERSLHCYAPMVHVRAARSRGDVSEAIEHRCFREWLTAPWSLVGLLAQINVTWFERADRYRPFLDASVDAWPVLNGVGPRYSAGSFHGQDLWNVHSITLKYVLANMGVPQGILTSPLAPGGVAQLAELTRSWAGVPLVDG